jgi:hypothetical protein
MFLPRTTAALHKHPNMAGTVLGAATPSAQTASNPCAYQEIDINKYGHQEFQNPPNITPQNGIPPTPHVFHIHVNPFQYVRTGPDGKPEMVWKDTLLIQAGQTSTFYTQYQDYIGQFVMHCHILDHEDLGMMEVVEAVDEHSGVATGHQH